MPAAACVWCSDMAWLRHVCAQGRLGYYSGVQPVGIRRAMSTCFLILVVPYRSDVAFPFLKSYLFSTSILSLQLRSDAPLLTRGRLILKSEVCFARML